MKRKIKIISILLFYTGISFAQERKHLLFDMDFSKDSLGKFYAREVFDKHAQVISDSVVMKGQKSVRIEVKSNNIGKLGIRSEFAGKPETYPERWYGLSIFAPKTYLPDPEPEIVTQWHNVPDFHLHETWTSPSLSMYVQDGRWNFHILWDTARVTKQGNFMGTIKYDLGPVKLNAWTNWVFHIKFSYLEDGLVEIYKDGQLVYTRKGPNSFNDAKLPYWKIGIYKWVYSNHKPYAHKFNQRVLFYSQIRKGDEHATYQDVAP